MIDKDGPNDGAGPAGVDTGKIAKHPYLKKNLYWELTNDNDGDDDNDNNNENDNDNYNDNDNVDNDEDDIEIVAAPAAIYEIIIDLD